MLDIVNEHFRHDKVRLHLLRCATGTLVYPEAPRPARALPRTDRN
ncbi:hypothetical protein [Bradyrhizobium erythrophlei]|nr:hypothetical protein [Bradyrhizobium erythrophlei]